MSCPQSTSPSFHLERLRLLMQSLGPVFHDTNMDSHWREHMANILISMYEDINVSVIYLLNEQLNKWYVRARC